MQKAHPGSEKQVGKSDEEGWIQPDRKTGRRKITLVIVIVIFPLLPFSLLKKAVSMNLNDRDSS